MGILQWLGSLLGGGQAQPQLACPSGLASDIAAPDLKENEEKKMSTTSSAQAYHNNLVGPVMRAGDLAMAVIPDIWDDLQRYGLANSLPIKLRREMT